MSEKEDQPTSVAEAPNSSASSASTINNQPENKNGGLNALLFIGSFLIVVGSGSLLAAKVDNLVKLFLILAMVVIFYIAGLFIRRVKVLVPAGTAFVCTSLAIMPFLGNAFYNFAGVSSELSWFLTSLIGTIAYVAAAFIMRSRLITFFSLGFVVSLFCSTPTALHMATLWNFLAVISVSILANLINFIFKDKIPKDFRAVLTHTARWLAVIVAFTTVFTNAFTLAGYDYSIIYSICLAQFILSYMATKNYADEVLGRLVAFPLFLSLFWNIFPANSSEFALIFALACISQIVYSFFSSILRSEKRNREISLIVVFMIFSLFSPLFAVSNKITMTIAPNIIAIIITSINLVLTILLSATWKQKAWLFASYPLAFLLPLYFEAGENQSRAVLITYALEFILFSAYYYFQKERNKSLELFNLIAFTIVLLFARSGHSLSISDATSQVLAESIIMNMIAMVVPAFGWLIFGLKDENKNKIEVAFYLFVACMGLTINQIIYTTVDDSTIASKINSIISPSLFLFAMIAMAFYRKSYARAIVGLSIFSYLALTYSITLSADISYRSSRYYYAAAVVDKTTDPLNIITQLIFLFEEIFVAALSAIQKRKATFWIAAGTIIAMTLNLTRGATYIWLILFGIAIICFVIWRLLKSQQPQGQAPKPEKKLEQPAPEKKDSSKD